MMQDSKNIEYWKKQRIVDWYKRQFEEPYRITIAFQKFIDENINISTEYVMDLGCGAGEVTSYFANIYKNANFLGLDINDELFKYCTDYPPNMRLKKGDWFCLNPKYKDNFKGVISSQVLSWLPEYEKPLEEICKKVNPVWIAISSLFWEGNIDYIVQLKNYNDCTKDQQYSMVNYNIYSVSKIFELLKKHGYNKLVYKPFEIDMDIPVKDSGKLQYYTIKTENGKRLAFNTCLYQPEGFIFASRE